MRNENECPGKNQLCKNCEIRPNIIPIAALTRTESSCGNGINQCGCRGSKLEESAAVSMAQLVKDAKKNLPCGENCTGPTCTAIEACDRNFCPSLGLPCCVECIGSTMGRAK